MEATTGLTTDVRGPELVTQAATTTERVPELVRFAVQDWLGARRVELEDVPRNATVAEIMDEVRRVLELPLDTAYHAIYGGRQLNHMETLEEVGIGSEATVEVVPEVSAGRGLEGSVCVVDG